MTKKLKQTVVKHDYYALKYSPERLITFGKLRLLPVRKLPRFFSKISHHMLLRHFKYTETYIEASLHGRLFLCLMITLL